MAEKYLFHRITIKLAYLHAKQEHIKLNTKLNRIGENKKRIIPTPT